MVAIFFTSLISILFLWCSAVFAKNIGAHLCQNQELYSCYTVKRGDSWEKLFHDADKRDLVMRINRMNIKLYPGLKIAIPLTDDVNPLNYSPLASNINPPGKNTIIVSMSKLAFGAYNAAGDLVYWGPISGGKGYCADIGRRCHTILGKFGIYHKRGADCVSSKFPIGRGGAPMPYCMFFHGGFALHGSYTVPGHHDSHGCVRLFVNDAKWLNQEFTNERTTVLIQK